MPKKEKQAQETPEQFPQEVYESHNHETAREFSADKQCQCDACKEHRGE